MDALTKQYLGTAGVFDNDRNEDLRKEDSAPESGTSGSESDEEDWMEGFEGELPGGIVPPAMRRQGNTGVKGVIGDYNEAKELAELKHRLEVKEAWEELHQQALTVKPLREQLEDERKAALKAEEEDDEDDEFLQKYRAKRLKEMRKKANLTFGFLGQVDVTKFVDIVEDKRMKNFIVIHVYQQFIPECTRLNTCLSELAVHYPSIQFLKLTSEQALSKFSDEVLPILLIYKEGELVKNLINLKADLGTSFVTDDVALLLASHKIISLPESREN